MARKPKRNSNNRPAERNKSEPDVLVSETDAVMVQAPTHEPPQLDTFEQTASDAQDDAKDVFFRIERPGEKSLLLQTKYPTSTTAARRADDVPLDGANAVEISRADDGHDHVPVAKDNRDLRDIADRVAVAPVDTPSTFEKIKSSVSDWVHAVADVGEAAYDRSRALLNARGIHGVGDVGNKIAATQARTEDVADTLRIGLGILFITGGLWKLSQLLSPAHVDAIVASYTAPTGYINEFFMAFLFGQDAVLTPWSFLTMLSAFELVSGAMLVAGLLVRPLALIYGFLLWTFVVSLPVVTTNGVNPAVDTYMAPAMLVQIRDIGLSGLMFALYCLGSGARSLDRRIFGSEAAEPLVSWENVGLLLRLSVAVIFLVGGLFAGMANIKAYFEPGIVLLVIAVALLWGGRVTRYGAAAACAVVAFFMITKLGFDKSVLANFNAVKREIAIFAATFVLAARDSGQTWTVGDVMQRLGDGLRSASRSSAVSRGTRGARGLQPAE